MWTATANTQCCATCANWAGPRELVRGNVETDLNKKGQCYAGVFTSSSQGFGPGQGGYCKSYQQWGALKR